MSKKIIKRLVVQYYEEEQSQVDNVTSAITALQETHEVHTIHKTLLLWFAALSRKEQFDFIKEHMWK